MFKVGRQAKRLQMLANKFYARAKSLDGPSTKWKWVQRDPKIVCTQLLDQSCTPEAGQHQIIFVQHRILVASYNLLQDLVGKDAIDSQYMHMFDLLTDTKVSYMVSEMEEMVVKLKKRHIWNVEESRRLCKLGTRIDNFTRYYTGTEGGTKSSLICIQYDLIEIMVKNLGYEEKN
jgi:hypothetical protein